MKLIKYFSMTLVTLIFLIAVITWKEYFIEKMLDYLYQGKIYIQIPLATLSISPITNLRSHKSLTLHWTAIYTPILRATQKSQKLKFYTKNATMADQRHKK